MQIKTLTGIVELDVPTDMKVEHVYDSAKHAYDYIAYRNTEIHVYHDQPGKFFIFDRLKCETRAVNDLIEVRQVINGMIEHAAKVIAFERSGTY